MIICYLATTLWFVYFIESTKKVYTNQWAVQIEGGIAEAKNVAQRHGFELVNEIMPDFYLLRNKRISKRSLVSSDSYANKLLSDAQVEWVEQQVVLKRVKRSSGGGLGFSDPKWPRMWYLNRGNGLDMNIIPAWRSGITGKGVVVCILDDGIEKDHPDIRKNYDPEASYDVNDQDPDPQPRYEYSNENRHGTRCAGEVAAEANNNICSIGVAYEARIGGIRMLDGDVTDAVEAQSLSWKRQHISIYSSSWGPDDDGVTVDGPAPLAWRALVEGITLGRRSLGSIFIWASGNGGNNSDSCNCDGYTNSIYTLSISSATEFGDVPWYSEACSSTLATTYSSGSGTERQIVTTDLRRGCTEGHTGTSASAPIAAGICALVLQASPYLTWRDMQNIVVLTSRPESLNANDWTKNALGRKVSHHFGYGLLDVAAMINLAQNWTTLPPQRQCHLTYVGNGIPGRGAPVFGRLELELLSEGCRGTPNKVSYLEHVQAIITLSTSNRGEVQIFLTSPSGTKSTLLSQRPKDTSAEGFTNWAFMTTHCWGESSTGTWKLEVTAGSSICKLGGFCGQAFIF
ncbi:hypothetical protein HELRODRAFT_84740 [Helobdella robusta]|uniref:P/Homo B domain-containing protein n=1 Tax=Helobdella robusta TaxID=6412 RepID=T1G5N0_HELRO|nr:hypothetical protein HELRODRAFT_84740 [Helobdella robusta]ESN98256.1 hypothetical protein HELRODRAFT_84740 [Helobdella robusta]